MILLIDNYDSFTYNLYQYLCELGAEVVVHRNDEITLEDVEALSPPGHHYLPRPWHTLGCGHLQRCGAPFWEDVPTLGVCLGNQCVGHAFGGAVVNAGEIMHGKLSRIHHDGEGLFRGLPNPLEAIRYHSLVVSREDLPPELEVTAWTDNGLIMGLRHRELPIEGVQFHPESIMTESGKPLLQNFLDGVR